MKILYLMQSNFFLKANLLKNTPTKEGDSYYVVSEDSSTTVNSDNNESNSQEETPSNQEMPKLGETSTQNVKEHESSEKITKRLACCRPNFLHLRVSPTEGLKS